MCVVEVDQINGSPSSKLRIIGISTQHVCVCVCVCILQDEDRLQKKMQMQDKMLQERIAENSRKRIPINLLIQTHCYKNIKLLTDMKFKQNP